jgi:hypothetical protein
MSALIGRRGSSPSAGGQCSSERAFHNDLQKTSRRALTFVQRWPFGQISGGRHSQVGVELLQLAGMFAQNVGGSGDRQQAVVQQQAPPSTA